MTYDPGAFDVLNANKFVNVVGATLDADRFNQANKAFSFSGMGQFIEYHIYACKRLDFIE